MTEYIVQIRYDKVVKRKSKRTVKQLLDQPTDFRLIPLTQGQVAKVSVRVFERLNKHNWYAARKADGKFYAFRKFQDENFEWQRMPLGNDVLGLPYDVIVDHIYGDTLDNRDTEIREVTQEQNMMNRGVPSNNTTGFQGVSFDKDKNLWKAKITHKGKFHHLGYRKTKEEAAELYRQASRELRGEFSRI